MLFAEFEKKPLKLLVNREDLQARPLDRQIIKVDLIYLDPVIRSKFAGFRSALVVVDFLEVTNRYFNPFVSSI